MSGAHVPSGWRFLPLQDLQASGDYSLVGGPFGSDLTTADYMEHPGVPVIRGTNMGGKESRFVDGGFVFVSDFKANELRRNCAFPGDLVFTQRGTLGQVAIIPSNSRFPRYLLSQSQMKLTPDSSRIDGRFLYHYFRSPNALGYLLSQTQATGVPHINLAILKRFPVLVAPIADQRRIAEVLDRAEALRAKRRAALDELDSLTPSLFIDLFGDPATNPKRWEIKRLCDLVAEFRYGSSKKAANQGNPTLRIPNVAGGTIDLTNLKLVPVEAAELERLRLLDGDVLFVRTNGNPEFVGRCAVFDSKSAAASGFDGNEFIFASYLIRARLAAANIAPVFLREYLLGNEGRRQLRSRSKTSAGQFNINTEGLGAIPVPFPPITLQREFSRRVAAVEKLKAAQRASLAELDALFASLQHRAFRGEL